MSISDIEQNNSNNKYYWFEDNTVVLSPNIFTDLKVEDRYFNSNKDKNVSSIVGKSPLYRNYISPSGNKDKEKRNKDKENFAKFVGKLSNIEEEGKNLCEICSRSFTLSPKKTEEQNTEKLNEAWQEKNNNLQEKDNDFNMFLSKLQRYNVAHNNLIAPSIKKFPNAFWNLNNSILVCPLCAFLIIHHHIPFDSAKTQIGKIFINASSFEAMWHLNKYASKILNERKKYQLKEILGISLIELAQNTFITLGVWSIMNIEMVIIKETTKHNSRNKKEKKQEIDYYSLPYEISNLLLNKDITSLINQTKEELILEMILNGKFDKLLKLNQKILRYVITNTNAFEDKYLSDLKNKDARSLKRLSMILPELYIRINSILKEE